MKHSCAKDCAALGAADVIKSHTISRGSSRREVRENVLLKQRLSEVDENSLSVCSKHLQRVPLRTQSPVLVTMKVRWASTGCQQFCVMPVPIYIVCTNSSYVDLVMVRSVFAEGFAEGQSEKAVCVRVFKEDAAKLCQRPCCSYLLCTI